MGMLKLWLNDPEFAYNWYIIRNGRRVYRKVSGKGMPRVEKGRFGGRKQIPLDESSEYLIKKIESNKPFFAGRYGSIEAEYMYSALRADKSCESIQITKSMRNLGDNCGFFPINEDSIRMFSNIMVDATSKIDFVAQTNLDMLSWFLKYYLSSDAVISHFRSLDFYRFEHPYTRALAGKKVLVIHPFVDSIEKQYKHSETLFSNPDILPKFELQTLKAVQTIAGNRDPRFKTWFEGLDYMTEECAKRDFDIAIIGCGAYGFPLAARIKDMGKQALHLGGVTQILFGVWGSRWNLEPDAARYKNEYWISPTEQERPKGSERIEGGCYW